MKVIMNPPYCRNLHLKILSEVLKHSDDVVSLQPVRWLQDPLAEYKKSSDWKKFEEIRDKVESVEVLDQAYLSSLFQCSLTFGMGVYKAGKEGSEYKYCKANSILDKLMKSGKYGIKTTTVSKATKPVYCLVNTIDGAHSEREGSCGPSCEVIRNEKWYGKYYINGVGTNGRTLAESKALNKRSTNGNIDNWPCVEFDTKEEAENFYESVKTKFFRYIYKVEITAVNVPLPYLPWLDWTKKWTDQDLYKYFNLTDEEIAIIEEKK